MPVGAGAGRAQAEQPRIVQLPGLRVAFLGFTDLFNINLNRGGRAPGCAPWIPTPPSPPCAGPGPWRTRWW